jgi:hypothetical protein
VSVSAGARVMRALTSGVIGSPIGTLG